MPEGDTVFRAAARVDAALAGRTLTAAEFRTPSLADVAIEGWRVVGARSRGKHLLIDVVDPARVGSERVIHTHLKMEGFVAVLAGRQRWPRPAHAARLVLRAGEVSVVGFSLGFLRWRTPADLEEALGGLGPDLLGAWDEAAAAEAVRRLGEDPGRPIGEAVLDQTRLAGIGNVFRAELLFLRGLSPWRPAGEVDLGRVVALSRRLLLANRDRTLRTTTGVARPGESLWVYGRHGQGCRRCGTRIERARQGGEESLERTVWWCPRCQSQGA